MDSMDYKTFFKKVTEISEDPYPYQERLANEPWPDLLDIPTGLGKTAGVVVAWLYKRLNTDKDTPRRLVYCLPMRVLVEQTYTNAEKWLANAKKLSATQNLRVRIPEIHMLMGDKVDRDWVLYPERDAILIGTQDMFLSRALNRGYASGRARWPMDFGLLNNDCLWVFDEVQLMSTGLATSMQLDAWRRNLHLRRPGGFPEKTNDPVARCCRSLWMSATMAKHWLDSAVDWKPHSDKAWTNRHFLSHQDYAHDRVKALFKIRKAIDRKNPVATLEKPRPKEGRPDKVDAAAKTLVYIDNLAKAIQENRSKQCLTLVILNTVDRAVRLYSSLFEKLNGIGVHLVHSRFRPMEREEWRALFSSNERQPRVIVSTQVVEAGVDLSAEVLFTELAPWASLVQRFGRCARYPEEEGAIYWLDVAKDDSTALPYALSELEEAKKELEKLTDVGLRSMEVLKEKLDQPTGKKHAEELFPYDPRFVPREKDLFDLFDTTPDLTGADVDISRFIRDDREMDIQVFWRDIGKNDLPEKKIRPERRELCPVAFYRFREQMGSLLRHGRIWRWSYRDGWRPLTRDDQELVYPGQVFLLDKACGGYHRSLGWSGKPEDQNFGVVSIGESEGLYARLDENDAEEEGEPLSMLSGWVKLADHLRHVCEYMDSLGTALLDESDGKLCNIAARWHDRGKAHKSFEASLKPESLMEARPFLDGQPAAKAPDSAWRPPLRKNTGKLLNEEAIENKRRPGFRHELAGALAILETLRIANPGHQAFAWPKGLDKNEFGCDQQSEERKANGNPASNELGALKKEELDLLLYLVASHHGKVRMSLRGSLDDTRTDVPDPCPPNLRQARGVRDGDALPASMMPGKDESEIEAPTVALNMEPVELGLSCRYGPSWRDRMQNLLERRGPFRLAYMEALLRIADWRASAEEDKSA